MTSPVELNGKRFPTSFPGSLFFTSLAPWDVKRRDPGNEVETLQAPIDKIGYFEKRVVGLEENPSPATLETKTSRKKDEHEADGRYQAKQTASYLISLILILLIFRLSFLFAFLRMNCRSLSTDRISPRGSKKYSNQRNKWV